MLSIIEKVILLQEVEVFEFTSTEDLTHVASIADEVTYSADETIFKEESVANSMYIVIKGKVRLHKNGSNVMIAEDRDVFGTWALFDDEPNVVTATTLEDSRLLTIEKEDFLDLLADNSRIVESTLKSIVKRLRDLLWRTSKHGSS